jgi:hypothetical protein
MLTAKENMRQCIKGGKPDRYVNQYEAIQFFFTPYDRYHNPSPKYGEENVVNAWGITYSFPEGTPGGFPVHTADKIVVKDIEDWREYVHAPSLDFPEEEWEQVKKEMDAADDEKGFKCVFVAPGIFEETHHLCSIDEALMNYMVYPDEMHELVEYITDFEMEYAKLICEKLKPNMILHHDDWGSQDNSFLRPEMFEEFFVEPYKKVYGYYHDHGVEFIVHHSDSYGANLVPYMIEMGIDVWQGPMETNNVAELVKKYQGQITFMGDIDNKDVDFTGWTPADTKKTVRRSIESVNSLTSYIPCITQGGPGSVFPGIYRSLLDEIALYNQEKFGFPVEEQFAMAPPAQILFGEE